MSDAGHGPDCSCTRCRGFEPGNELSVTHGAFSVLKLSPRVDEIAALVRELVPAWRPPDDVAVHLLAISLARIEAVYEAVAAGAIGELDSVEDRLIRWVNAAARQADKLAMTPTARGRLGLDVAQMKRARTLADLHAAAAAADLDGEPLAEELEQ